MRLLPCCAPERNFFALLPARVALRRGSRGPLRDARRHTRLAARRVRREDHRSRQATRSRPRPSRDAQTFVTPFAPKDNQLIQRWTHPGPDAGTAIAHLRRARADGRVRPRQHQQLACGKVHDAVTQPPRWTMAASSRSARKSTRSSRRDRVMRAAISRLFSSRKYTGSHQAEGCPTSSSSPTDKCHACARERVLVSRTAAIGWTPALSPHDRGSTRRARIRLHDLFHERRTRSRRSCDRRA